jgi:hypothetical protein
VNEVQTLRREIASQRRSLRELAAACRTPGADREKIGNSEACRDYLMFSLHQERGRLRAHLECLRASPGLTAPERSTLDRASDALRAIESGGALGAPEALTELLLAHILPTAEALEAIAERHYGVEDWRRAAHVDADSILEARRLRQRVIEHGASPAGH